MTKPRSVVLLSGGLDSTTLLFDVARQGGPVTALSFDYGQRHRKELVVAVTLVDHMSQDVTHEIVHLAHWLNEGFVSELAPLANLLSGSALTDPSVDVPDGHYGAESMKATVVPNRNAIMLSIAYGVAVAQRADAVFVAVHAGDHLIYPDCRPEFIDALGTALTLGNQWRRGDWAPALVAPYIKKSKADIARTAYELGVPIERTWSCYKGADIHCGRCGTCVERREAIETARVALGVDEPDPTQYEDRDYWRTVVGTETAG